MVMLKALSVAALVGSVVVGAASDHVPTRVPAVWSGVRSELSLAVSQPAAQAAVRYVTTGAGNKARYRVRERLVGKELDNDAIGETPEVTGTIALDKTGRVLATESSFAAVVTGLVSDQTRRDRYVRARILKTDSFPTTTFKATEVRGLSTALPKSGKVTFQLIGDLTVKGVTRPSTWTVTATVNGDQLTGQAATRFTFKEFSLLQPRVPVVMSVADTIGLEYDFVMVKR